MSTQLHLTDGDWDTLLARIRAGTCTPFLGAAVNYGLLPLGAEIANEWAKAHHYPLESRSDLAKVAQFLGVHLGDLSRPKELILELLDQRQKPLDFNDDAEPLNTLAKLPFPLYITTNYDELLYSAIEQHGRASDRRPQREICKWNNSPLVRPILLKRGAKFKLSAQAPLIYHLHGHKSVSDSVVLTEDDYLEFIVNMSRNFNSFLPSPIQSALSSSSLMFVGYSLSDIDFRVIFRGLRGNLDTAWDKMSVAVQLPIDDANPNKASVEKFLTEYFGSKKIKIYWGSARQFAEDLWNRWSVFNVGRAS